MTYPKRDPLPWGQPTDAVEVSSYPQEIAPLGPPPPTRSAGWLVVVLVLVCGLAGGIGLLVAARDDVSGSPIAAPGTTTGNPTTTREPAPRPGAKLSYTDYEGPWDFRYNGVALQADWVSGRDNDNCEPIDQSGKLAALGCRYAAELELSAEAGGVRFLQFILAMPDAATASTAAAEIDDTDLKARPGSRIENYATGKWKAGAQDQFIVVTMVTATAAVDTALVNKYLGYRHADILGAIAFR
ncbi:hypothetical protein [Nocardia asteroides]